MQIMNSESAVNIQRPQLQIKCKRFFCELSTSDKEPESPEEETGSDYNEKLFKFIMLLRNLKPFKIQTLTAPLVKNAFILKYMCYLLRTKMVTSYPLFHLSAGCWLQRK
ncbi:hypothetical protein PR048_013438 [Dryococelus australis]|uniref:Uncharacterized protein n=1 Tax=Dryococelus australis TaxID=614101 RepID=A0ABQ9HS62_9NEOP|nr:hypothetical protein PR048_013438 [Dryococelus australis]